MYDLIIMGAGPAGLSAAVYGTRAGLDLMVIERNPICGGQILDTYSVDNYLGFCGLAGQELANEFRKHADTLGVQFKSAYVTRVVDKGTHKEVHTSAGVYETKTVIVATGASHTTLGVPGEGELAGMGVSYCATCDGAFFKDLDVCVVGGGDVALEDAIYLARTCRKVYIIHRRDEFRGAKILEEQLRKLPNVELVMESVVSSIEGEDSVTGVKIENVRTKERKEIEVSGVFIAVGILPKTEIIRDLVNCDEGGYVIAGEDCVTNVPGLFVAGDIRRKPMRQIITAVSDGANAAVKAGEYCNTH